MEWICALSPPRQIWDIALGIATLLTAVATVYIAILANRRADAANLSAYILAYYEAVARWRSEQYQRSEAREELLRSYERHCLQLLTIILDLSYQLRDPRAAAWSLAVPHFHRALRRDNEADGYNPLAYALNKRTKLVIREAMQRERG